MILCLDVGNTQIYGGVFSGNQLQLQFRRSSTAGTSSDETGLFLRSVLRENNINPDNVHQIAICSVVPDALHSLKNCCLKYFKIRPFVLQAGVKTGLKINYRNPAEVGADRISNAVAATQMFPNQNMIIVDFGTATTFCAVSAKKEYLGGVIIPGMKISMRSLETNTAKLPAVEILKPESAVGRGTVESIQSGLFYGAVGSIKEICQQITKEVFPEDKPLVIGTGGFASLFKDANVFDREVPDLVLQGLHQALELNA